MPLCTEYQHGNVCCSIEQVDAIVTNVARSASLMSRCPSCINNFARFFCAMVCHPDQSLFLTPLSLFNSSNPDSWVRSIALNVYSPFTSNLYDSCKEVKFPSTGTSIMTVMGGSTNYQQFINFLGTSSGSPPPLGALMDITVSYANISTDDYTNTTTLTPSTTSSNQSALYGMTSTIDDCSLSCSCTDCPGSCPAIPPPQEAKDTRVKIGNSKFALSTFIVFVIGLVGVLLILGIGLLLYFTRPKPLDVLQAYKAEKKVSHENLGLLSLMAAYFRMHGRFVARRPWSVILIAILFIGFSLCWVWRLKVLTKPEDLWVPPSATTLKDKARFDSTFGAFYRIDQAILQQKGVNKKTPILTISNLLKMLQAHEHLVNMNVTYTHQDTGHIEIFNLSSICFRPLVGKGCLVNSPLNYFQEDSDKIQYPFNPSGGYSVTSYVQYCSVAGQFTEFCMTSIGTPVDAQNVLGGYTITAQGASTGSQYVSSTALVFTFLLNNEATDSLNYRQLAWEKAFIDYWKNSDLKDTFDIGFSTDRSIQDELERESFGDIPTIVISYVVMFVYVSLALGSIKRPIFYHSKVLLALAGILVVIFSVAISIGLCALFAVPATLIITEVIPFLVLAIGVDNIFIMVDTFGSLDNKMSIEQRTGEMLSRVGASITMAAFSEGAAFLLGMLTRMPAVTAFAVYACVAILFNWALQITFFLALVVLDARRQNAGRYDILFCIKNSALKVSTTEELPDEEDDDDLTHNNGYLNKSNGSEGEVRMVKLSTSSLTESGSSIALNGNGITEAEKAKKMGEEEGDEIVVNGLVAKFFNRFYAPALLHPLTKMFVLAAFLVILLACIGFIPRLEIGLPQEQAMPSDSYLVDYYDALAKVGRAGPPVYIVLEGPFNYTDRVAQNKLCSVDARTGGCLPHSMDNTFYTNTRQPSTTPFLTNSTLASWLDTYLIWLRPTTGCCNLNMVNFTGATPYDNVTANFCWLAESTTLPASCSSCLTDADFDAYGRPSEEDFMKFFSTWLQTKCVTACGSCGSVFQSEIQLDTSKPETSSEYINATRFRAFHRNLVTQKDFIDALKRTYDFSEDLNDNLGLRSYPYSSYYIFFEQYLYVQNVAKLCIGVALAAIFGVSLILLSNLYSAIIITVIVGIIQVDLIGVMAWWKVDLNAVSVVNLVMAIGISVEFSSHIVHSFLTHNGTRQHRAKLALVEMGSSVLKGITLTKFVGVIVLAFARSQIFQIYYFRMFFSIVILAALHCLIFLPVFLSLLGPRTRRGAFSFL